MMYYQGECEVASQGGEGPGPGLAPALVPRGRSGSLDFACLSDRAVKPLALAMGIEGALPAGRGLVLVLSLDMCSTMEYPLYSSSHTDNRILFGRSRVNRSPG